MYGRTYWGNERTTFIVGPDGGVAEVLRKVKPAEHDARVLAALAEVASSVWTLESTSRRPATKRAGSRPGSLPTAS